MMESLLKSNTLRCKVLKEGVRWKVCNCMIIAWQWAVQEELGVLVQVFNEGAFNEEESSCMGQLDKCYNLRIHL
jgi:hypothetical protein